MKASTTIEFKNYYLYVRRLEDANLNEIEDAWRDIAAACRQHNCYNILVESFFGKIPIEDILLRGGVMGNAGINSRHRIAWVHHQKESLEDVEKIEDVIRKQGAINFELFPNVEDALKWLLIIRD